MEICIPTIIFLSVPFQTHSPEDAIKVETKQIMEENRRLKEEIQQIKQENAQLKVKLVVFSASF